MGFKGSLESINLADVFQNLAQNQQTGTLRVHHRDRLKYLYFDRGEIKYLSRGKKKNVRLGDMLVGRGIATPQQIEQALEYQATSGRLLGEVFVEMNIVSQEDIDALVRFQIEEEVYELFLWNQAEFEFIDGPPSPDLFDPEQQTTEVSINTSSLIMEAARRLDEWEGIRRVLSSTQEVYVLTPEAKRLLESGTLEPLQSRLLEFCDGTRDVDDVVADSFFSRFEVEETLAEMVQKRRIRPAERGDLERAITQLRSQGRPERAMKLLEKVLAMTGGSDLAIRERLAETCLELRDEEKAAIHLGILAQDAMEKGEEERAIQLWEQILELNPRHLPARENLARVRAQKNQKREALQHYIKIIGIHSERGQTKRAMDVCRTALQIEPSHLDIRRQLIQLHLECGNRSAAIAELEVLAERHLSVKNQRGAADAYRQILQIDQKNVGAQQALNNLLRSRTEKKRATVLRYVKTAMLALFLGGALVYGLLEYRSYKDWEESLQEAEAVVQAVPKTASRKEKIAALETAIAMLESFERRMSLPLFDVQSRARRQREHYRQDIMVLQVPQREDDQKKTDDQTRELLAKASDLRQDGNYDEAREMLERAAKLDASSKLHDKAHSELQQLRNRESEIKHFVDWYHRVDRQTPNQSLASIADRISKFLHLFPVEAKAMKLMLPLSITSRPEGSTIEMMTTEGDAVQKVTTPALVWYPVDREVRLRVERRGYVSSGPSERTFKLQREGVVPETVAHFVLERERLWERSIGGRVVAGPVMLHDKYLLMGTEDGDVLVLNPEDGKTLHSYTVSMDTICTDFMLHDGLVLFGTRAGNVHVLRSSEDGQLKALYPQLSVTTGAVAVAPSVARESLTNRQCIFVCGRNNTLHCLNLQNGKPQWRSPARISGIPVMSPIVVQSTVYVGTQQGRMHAFKVVGGQEMPGKSMPRDAADRVTHWEHPTQWVNDETGTTIYFGDESGLLHRLDLTNGKEEKWSVGGPVVVPPTLQGPLVYTVTQHGRIDCRSRMSGQIPPQWSPEGSWGLVSASPAASDAFVYGASEDGTLHCLDAATGMEVWTYQAKEAFKVAPVAWNNRVFAVDRRGTIYAFAELQ